MVLALWYHDVAALFFAVIAALLILVVLLQRGKGVGLAGAFGGAGGGAAFGAKTGDMLTWVTIVAAVVMLTFAVVLNYVFRPIGPGLGGSQTANPPAGAPATPADAGEGEGGAWHLEDPISSPPLAHGGIFGERDA